MPGAQGTPPVHAAYEQRFQDLLRRVEALEYWTRLQGEGPWVVPTLEHSWAQDGPATVGYRRKGSQVFLRGRVSGGVAGKTVFTLPEGYRPTQQWYQAIIEGSAGTVGYVIIEPSGTVGVYDSGGGGSPSFDGISFFTN